MIDLHNHILPALDDGAVDLAESVEIARQFASEGVTIVAATPHLDPLRGRGPTAQQVQETVGIVQAAIKNAAIALTVLPGNELFLTPDADALVRSGRATRLAGTRFVLVEVSLTSIERPIYLDDTLFRLQLAGFKPILGHPERYSFVQRDALSVETLVARGIHLQLTAPSLQGEYGGRVRRTAQRLLQQGLYSLAASDRHHPGQKRSLADLHHRLVTMFDQELADLLVVVNPGRVLDDKDPLRPDVMEPGRSGLLNKLFGGR